MATYQKRGYKKSVEIETEVIEETPAQAEESTTAEIFNTLDEKANQSEKWIEKNSKNLLVVLAVFLVFLFGYMGYNQFISKPAEQNAANALVFSKQEFLKAKISLLGLKIQKHVQKKIESERLFVFWLMQTI